MTHLNRILARLKAGGHRLTQIRQRLIQFILEQQGHWTIQDLADRVKNHLPGVGVATIYRTVSLLLHEGVLTETRFGGLAARYEVTPRHHHDHLKCVTCGEIFEFENDRIEELQKSVAKKLGFKLKDHRMELYAECTQKNCKYRKAKA